MEDKLVKSDYNIELTKDIVLKYLVRGNVAVTEQEVFMFINLCKMNNLNPFINEAYLIKYGSECQMIVAYEVFKKRASRDNCLWNSGITVIKYKDKEKTEIIEVDKPGIVLDGERLVGGWCEAKGHKVKPSIKEYAKPGKNGKRTTWDTLPETMIKKVATAQCLRDIFPEMSQMYIAEEVQQQQDDDEKITPLNIPTQPATTATQNPTKGNVTAKSDELPGFD